MKPRGGTELQFEFLEKHVDKELLDQVQICTSEILGVPGQEVTQGEVLAKITSTELTQSQLAYLKARTASQLAEQAANRARILYKEDVIALAELQRREAEAMTAKAELRAANDQLRVQGMDQKSIDRLAKSGVIESINNVIATIPGQIVERKIWPAIVTGKQIGRAHV